MINALLPSDLGLNQGSEGTFRWWSYGTIPGALNADGVKSLTTTPNILFLFVALFAQACRNDSSGASGDDGVVAAGRYTANAIPRAASKYRVHQQHPMGQESSTQEI